jgi:5-carboxymethyl-2-hydroxymuconate isomerase
MKTFFRTLAILVGSVSLAVLFLYAMSSTVEAGRQESFKQVYAKCKLEILQKGIEPKDEVRYLYLCMNSHGYDDNEFAKRVDAHGVPL